MTDVNSKLLEKLKNHLNNFIKGSIVSYLSFSYENKINSLIGFFCKNHDGFNFFYPRKIKHKILEEVFDHSYPIILCAHKENKIVDNTEFIKIFGEAVLLKKEDEKLILDARESIQKISPFIAQEIKGNFYSYYILKIKIITLEYNFISLFKKGEYGVILSLEDQKTPNQEQEDKGKEESNQN